MPISDHTAYRTRQGASLPATCNPGDLFTDSVGGAVGLYVCVVANTWVGPFGTGTGTVTSVSASGGTETTTGSAITSTGTIRGVELINALGSTSTYGIVDGDRGKLLTSTRGPTSVQISLPQAGTAGSFAAGWFCVVKKVFGAATITITPATSLINGDVTLTIATGQTAKIISDGTDYQVEYFANNSASAGITNSAPGGNVPKTVDGIGNLEASQITDNGVDVIATGQNVNLETVTGNSHIRLSQALDTIELLAQSESLSIAGTAHTITTTAATSVSNVTPLWGAGKIGTEFQIGGSDESPNNNGKIVRYADSLLLDGEILIGKTSDSTFGKTTISAGIGISITNGAGSITIAQDPLTSGTVLSVLSANATLASATGTTYSSPGYGGTPLASTSEAQVGWVCPRAGTISKLYVITGSVAKVNTPATTITIRKAGVDTAVTLLLTQTTATVSSDLTHSFSVVAGDVITISFTTTGAAAVSTSIAGISFVLN